MDDLRIKVDRLRRRMGHTLSSHAFPSIWIWKECMGLELCLEAECFAVRAAKQGEHAWFFPCGSECGKQDFLNAHEKEPGLELLYLRREDADWLEAHFPQRWNLCRRPEADEYLYRRDRHIAMEGAPFRDLRRRLRKIRREMAPQTRILDGSSAADARLILDAWASGHASWGGDDRQAALRALEQREQLGMRGIVVYLEDRPAAFMLGFPLADDTFDAAIGKCALDVQGLTYFVLRELMLSLPRRYQWFNLEEDLGLTGLREMKEHFRPDGRHEIWEARRR